MSEDENKTDNQHSENSCKKTDLAISKSDTEELISENMKDIQCDFSVEKDESSGKPTPSQEENITLSPAKEVMQSIVKPCENDFSSCNIGSSSSVSDNCESKSVPSPQLNLQNSDIPESESCRHGDNTKDVLPETGEIQHSQMNVDGLEVLLSNTQKDLGEKIDNTGIENSASDKEMADVSELSMDCDSTQSETWLSTYNFSSDPIAITGSWMEFKKIPSNFTKGCKWSPDGTCIVTNSDDHCLKLFNLPSEFYDRNQLSNWRRISEMNAVLNIQEGDTVYDFCWYPFMNSMDPPTCCLASTSRNSPIHLFDAFTGSLLCSYRPYNNVDEVESAYSLAFDLEGRKLYSGFKNYVRIFDVNTPGRQIQDRNTKGHGQTGIVSCICFNPANPNLYAAGSYLRSVSLFSEPEGTLVCLLQGQQGGITHMMFSLDGTKIFTGGRKDNEILCWDLRNCGDVYCVMQREVNTNQRIQFDLDRSGRHLISGSTNGEVLVWDLLTPPEDSADGEPLLKPIKKFHAHDDCVNGVRSGSLRLSPSPKSVSLFQLKKDCKHRGPQELIDKSFHPTLPLVASSSGQRKYPDPVESDDSSSSDSDTELFTSKYIKEDNSLRLWWVGGEIL